MSDSASYLAYVASVPRLRAAAGALLRDNEGRVLVVHPVYKDDWAALSCRDLLVQPNPCLPGPVCPRRSR